MARQTSRNYVYTLEPGGVEVVKVFLNHLPIRTIQPQRSAGVLTHLNQRKVFMAGPFKPKSLAACSRAELEHVTSAWTVFLNLEL
jgi:hypothetical protein